MLSREIEIYDLDGAHLAAWLGLLVPPGVGEPSWAILFIESPHRVVHAVRAGTGAVDPATVRLSGTAPADLAQARRALGVGFLAVLTINALGRLQAEIDRRLRLDDDYPGQCLAILRALKQQSGAGIWTEPRVLDLIPPLAQEPLQRTFELLVPNRSAIMAYVFDARPPEVHASVIAVVEDGDISLVTTHLGIADALPGPALARSWRAQTGRVLSLVEERYASPSIGLFADRAALQRILVGPSDQLSREMTAGRVVFDPAPAWLRGLLGGAQLAAFATRSARNLARLVPSSARRAAADLAQSAQERLKSAGAHPFALLGFDPLDLWHRVRAYYRPSGAGSTRPGETR
jgi:hypothetical protein